MKRPDLRGLWRSAREPVALFFATRVPLLVAMWASLLLIPYVPKEGQWRTHPENLWLDGWARWDSGWYLHIVRDGYWATPTPDGQRDVAFWPLFPAIVRIVSKVFATEDHAFVAFCVNHALLLGATVFLHRLARERLDRASARVATILFLLYPYGAYYSAAYTEATYLFFTLGAFWFAHKEQWGRASLMAGLASATRGVGIMTSVGVAIAYLEKRSWDVRRIRKDVLFLPLAGLGMAAYSLYLWKQFGEPFAYAESFSAKGWGADVTLDRLRETVRVTFDLDAWKTGRTRPHDIGCLSAFVLVTVMLLAGARTQPVYETIFGLACLFTYAKMWPTSGRYVGTIFPVYFFAARMLRKRPNARLFVYASFTMGIAICAATFGHWLWLSG